MSTVSDIFTTVAPWLTAALTGGPVGLATLAAQKLAGAIGLDDSSPGGVASSLQNLTLTGEQKVALQQAEYSYKEQMQQMGFTHQEQLLSAESGELAIVNKTMQVEDAATNAYAADWRPTWGYVSAAVFAFVAVVACGLESLAIWNKDPTALASIPQFISALLPLFGIAGAVLGINAWHGGVADVAVAKKGE